MLRCIAMRRLAPVRRTSHRIENMPPIVDTTVYDFEQQVTAREHKTRRSVGVCVPARLDHIADRHFNQMISYLIEFRVRDVSSIG
jgi:histone acetyltransferase (RNA polymerase elongator complex component)